MTSPVRVPIRLKILITLLILVTAVVSIITYTMANLFHRDKKEYINDLTSIVAMNVAEESRSVIVSYEERLKVYSRILRDGDLTHREKSSLLEGFFYDFPELVAVAIYEDGEEKTAVYNVAALEAAGLSKADLRRDREQHPLPIEEILGGEVYIRNSTLSERMPAMSLALATPTEGDQPPAVLSSVVRLDRLLELASRDSGFDVFIADADDVLLANLDVKKVARRSPVRVRADIKNDLLRGNALAVVREYVSRDGIEVIGGFAGLDVGNVVAGAQIPVSAAFLTYRSLLSRLLLVALGLLIVATLIGMIYARRITRPVEHLSGATRRIGKGDFEIEVQVESRDEMGALATSFNQMAKELKGRDEALNEAQSQLVQSEKMAAFGQLGAGIAHEVKNPLAGILGCAQLSLRKAEKETPLYENLKLIEKETKRCKTIIENLLKFARQEKAVMEPVQFNAVVEDAVAIVNHQLELHKVKLDTELWDNLPMIHGNANQLQQVLMNLMINAQQAMEGTPGQVTVSTRQSDAERIEIRVSDTGPGMTEEVRTKIFEPFFTTKPGGKGTGLGLSVSFGIVRDHGGEIRIETAPGEGATFIITLPILGTARAAHEIPQQVSAGA